VFRCSNTLYWLHHFLVSGFSVFQYDLLATPFPSIWCFSVPIRSIGYTISQYLVFRCSNTIYWLHHFLVSGVSVFQYDLLVTSFPSFWCFSVPIPSIGYIISLFLVFWCSNTIYWLHHFPVSGVSVFQYPLSVTSFPSIWCFSIPIRSIGYIISLFMVFRCSNTLYWLHHFPVSGVSVFQYALLVTPFPSFWCFSVPIRSIGYIISLFLVFRCSNTLYWCLLFPVSGVSVFQYALLVTSFPNFWCFGVPIRSIGYIISQYLVFQCSNTLYWLHHFPISGVLVFQYALLVTSFPSIWCFGVPIRSIGYTISQFLVFQCSKTIYWLHHFPVSGVSVFQYALLVTSFPNFWCFGVPIQPIGDGIHH